MAEELGERTEQPTARRRSEARGRGQVAKSQDLSSAIELSGAVIIVALFGGTAVTVLAGVMRRVLSGQLPGEPLDSSSVWAVVTWAARESAWLLIPALLLMFAIACAAQYMQVGALWTTKPLSPKFERLNPVAGIKRQFSRRQLVKTAVNSVKLFFVVLVCVLVIRRQLPTLISLPRLETAPALYMIALLAFELVLWLLPLLLVIGLIDWIYQRWQQTADLKMTKQEVQDERRSSEGDPEVKRRRHRMAHEIALQRIQSDVPKADVIVTNPTHFSVALRYDPARMNAPRVVAKGADHMAFRIRVVAGIHKVPIVERPPLARALFFAVEVGQEIQPEHFEAVAEVLAYVYRIAGRAA